MGTFYSPEAWSEARTGLALILENGEQGKRSRSRDREEEERKCKLCKVLALLPASDRVLLVRLLVWSKPWADIVL